MKKILISIFALISFIAVADEDTSHHQLWDIRAGYDTTNAISKLWVRNKGYFDHSSVMISSNGIYYNNSKIAPADYMEIEIPLNPAGSPGNWTDFELKIFDVEDSRDEFNDDHLVYYYQTMGDPWDGNNKSFGDTNALVYFIDDHNAFPTEDRGILKWSCYTDPTPGIVDSTSIADQLVDPDSVIDNVIIEPSHQCFINYRTWQSITNNHLRASFVRYDALGAETNSAGLQRWHPVRINWILNRKD